jgi:hypothetical protein
MLSAPLSVTEIDFSQHLCPFLFPNSIQVCINFERECEGRLDIIQQKPFKMAQIFIAENVVFKNLTLS